MSLPVLSHRAALERLDGEGAALAQWLDLHVTLRAVAAQEATTTTTTTTSAATTSAAIDGTEGRRGLQSGLVAGELAKLTSSPAAQAQLADEELACAELSGAAVARKRRALAHVTALQALLTLAFDEDRATFSVLPPSLHAKAPALGLYLAQRGDQ